MNTSAKETAPHMLNGIVEADETFVGGKDNNRHAKKRGLTNQPFLFILDMLKNYASLFILLVVCGCKTYPIHTTGKYYRLDGYIEYRVEISPDSTFEYVKRFEWPIDITCGRWRIENNKLILNSIIDTFPDRGKTLATYIVFSDKSYTINRNKIIDDSSGTKYKFVTH